MPSISVTSTGGSARTIVGTWCSHLVRRMCLVCDQISGLLSLAKRRKRMGRLTSAKVCSRGKSWNPSHFRMLMINVHLFSFRWKTSVCPEYANKRDPIWRTWVVYGRAAVDIILQHQIMFWWFTLGVFVSCHQNFLPLSWCTALSWYLGRDSTWETVRKQRVAVALLPPVIPAMERREQPAAQDILFQV